MEWILGAVAVVAAVLGGCVGWLAARTRTAALLASAETERDVLRERVVDLEATVENLVANGAVRKNQPVKVLGTGEITVAVNVSADAFSASAAEKIVAAGGTVTEL